LLFDDVDQKLAAGTDPRGRAQVDAARYPDSPGRRRQRQVQAQQVLRAFADITGQQGSAQMLLRAGQHCGHVTGAADNSCVGEIFFCPGWKFNVVIPQDDRPGVGVFLQILAARIQADATRTR